MKTVLTVLLLCLVMHASAQSPPTRIGAVKEGVYFLDGMFQTTIVELKNGRFRFWFSSDAEMGGDLRKYPLTGKYATSGGQVTFVTTNSYMWPGLNGKTQHTNHFLQTNRWTFINHNGRTTLWRPEALKYREAEKKLDGYGILLPTDKKPEEIWRGK